MRLCAVILIPFSVGLLANTFGRLTAVIVGNKEAIKQKEFLSQKMTETDLKIMDVNGDGNVSYQEFVTFMLVAMEKVDHEEMIRLGEIYQNLGVGGHNDGVRLEDLKLCTRRCVSPR